MFWLVGFVCVCVCVCVCAFVYLSVWDLLISSGQNKIEVEKKWLLACLQGRGWSGGEIDAKHWLDKSGRHTFSTFGTSRLSSSPPQNRQDQGVQECQLRCDLWFRTYTEDHIATRFRYTIFAYTNCHKVQIRTVMEPHSHKVQVRTELQSCTVIKFRSGPRYGAVQSSSSGQDRFMKPQSWSSGQDSKGAVQS